MNSNKTPMSDAKFISVMAGILALAVVIFLVYIVF
jgi:hypothetical protein